MNTYAFNVRVQGLDLDSEYQMAGLECLPYALVPMMSNGVVSVEVFIDATSPVDAVLRVYKDLGTVNITVVRVDLDLVNVADLAERAGVTRETARLWATGARRMNFPAHFTVVGESRAWAWADVHSWLVAQGLWDQADEVIPLPVRVAEGMSGAFAQMRGRVGEGWMQPTRTSGLASPTLSSKVVIEDDWVDWVRA